MSLKPEGTPQEQRDKTFPGQWEKVHEAVRKLVSTTAEEAKRLGKAVERLIPRL